VKSNLSLLVSKELCKLGYEVTMLMLFTASYSMARVGLKPRGVAKLVTKLLTSLPLKYSLETGGAP
jgi:hypothetical protein